MTFNRRVLIPSVLSIFVVLYTILASTQPKLIIIAIVGLLFVWQFLSLNHAIYFYLISITFNRLIIDAGPVTAKPEMLFSMICLAVLYILFCLRKMKITLNTPTIVFIVYILYVITTSFYLSSNFTNSLNGIIQLSVSFLGFFIISQVTMENLYRFVNVYIGLAVFHVVYALISFTYYQLTGVVLFGEQYGGLMLGQDLSIDWSTVTLRGGLYEANTFSTYVGAAIVFLLTMLLISNENVNRKIIILCLIICSAGILMGWTRSAWIGTVIGALVVFALNPKKIFRLKNIMLIVVLLCAIIPTFFTIQYVFDTASGEEGILASKFTNIFNTDGGTGKYRVDKFSFVLNHWSNNNEVLGSGYFSIGWIGNMPLAILHDTGLIGLCLFLSIILLILISSLKGFMQAGDDTKRRNYIIGMFGGIVVYLFVNNFSSTHTLAIFWIHLGFLWSLSRPRKSTTKGNGMNYG